MWHLTIILAIIGPLVMGDETQQNELSSASLSFSQRLYEKIARDVSNIVYSPYSIHSALTMTSLGARNDTFEEMSTTLGLKVMGDKVHQAYKELIQDLNSVENVSIFTVNALYVRPQQQLLPKFKDDAANYYFAETDFIYGNASGGPEKPINDFIVNKTKGMILDTLPSGTITDNTLMLLVNTIYFNGTWETQFDKSKTKNETFLDSKVEHKQIEMMHDDRRVIFLKRDYSISVDIAELPFVGGRFSMYIALPQLAEGITSLENLLDQPDVVKNMFIGLNEVSVQLAIPKFKIETFLLLKNILIDLGMVKAFDPDKADFSGLATRSTYIEKVMHKVTIDLQETGTAAAAATVVQINKKNHLPDERFIADHPFVYFLRDKITGQILFQGKFSG